MALPQLSKSNREALAGQVTSYSSTSSGSLRPLTTSNVQVLRPTPTPAIVQPSPVSQVSSLLEKPKNLIQQIGSSLITKFREVSSKEPLVSKAQVGGIPIVGPTPVVSAVKQYTEETAVKFLKSIVGVGRLTPFYLNYRASTGNPVTPKEYLDNLISTPLTALETLWRTNPAAPAVGATLQTLTDIRRKMQGKGTWEDILNAPLKGVNDQPGFGQVFTDNVQTAQAIDILFLGAMLVTGIGKTKLNKLTLSAEEISNASKTLGVKPNASMDEVANAFKSAIKEIPDTFTNDPLPANLDKRKALTDAYNILKSAGVIDKKFAAAYEFLNNKAGIGTPLPEIKPKELGPGEKAPEIKTPEVATRKNVELSKPEGVQTASLTVKGDTASMTVQIAPKARGQGLGTAVVNEAENKAKAQGAKTMVVSASTQQNGTQWDNSVGFWEKQGYTTVQGATEKNGTIKMEKSLTVAQPPKGDITLYHGTDAKFDDFDFKKTGLASGEKPLHGLEGAWFTNDKNVASGYGKNIKEAKIDTSNFHVVDAKGERLNDFRDELWDAKKYVKDNNKSGLVVKNLVDNKDWSKQDVADHIFVVDKKVISPQPPKATATKPLKQAERKQLQKQVQDAVMTGSTQEESIKNINTLVDKVISDTNSPAYNSKLKAVAAELKRTMFSVVGADTGNWKKDYALFQELRNNPEVSDVIDTLETAIFSVEESIKPVAKPEPVVTPPEPVSTQKPSKIARSIEQKAIENKLTSGFGGLAGYDPITIKEQAKLAAKVLKNPDEASAIIRGEKPLPEGLKGTALITAAEEYAIKNGDSIMVYDLANSPLVSATSKSAQELRLAAERQPDSLTARLNEVKKKRQENVKKEQVKQETAKIKKEIKAPTTKDWQSFIDSIEC